MLPINCGSHSDYQDFVVRNLRKYYPDPNALARSTWDIIERFWDLDLSFTDELLKSKYSKYGPAPRTPYKNYFTIGEDGVPVCMKGLRMNHDGSEPSKHRLKFRCPLTSRKNGCSCDNPCSKSKYGRTVHVVMKDNPRLFNIPSRDSAEWKNEYNGKNFCRTFK